jgi:hypothetical protein
MLGRSDRGKAGIGATPWRLLSLLRGSPIPSGDSRTQAVPTSDVSPLASRVTPADDSVTRGSLRLSVAVGIVAALVAGLHHWLLEPWNLAYDFTWPWRAARYLLAGHDPYVAIQPTGEFPFDATFKYPLPAALLALPLAPLGPYLALALFSGVSAGVLTYAIRSRSPDRWPILLSAPMLATVLSGQWSALLAAGFLVPAWSALYVAKPTLGAALWAGRPTWAAIGGGAALLAASWLTLPGWLGGWLTAVRTDPAQHYLAPVMLTGGPLVLLALVRWRQPEARLVAALACVPQVLTFYNALPVLLAARTRRESLVAAALSSVGWLAWDTSLGGAPVATTHPVYAGYWMLATVYLPALVIVLRRPNVTDPC